MLDHGSERDSDERPDSVAPEHDTGFLTPEPGRRHVESVLARLVATAGIVGIGTAFGALLDAASVAGWIVGLVVSLLTVVLAAVLWRSKTL